jgi:3-phytase
MGVSLYKRPRDSAMFAIVAPKTGGTTNYLWQYRLQHSGDRVSAHLVRRFGAFSRRGATPFDTGEIEAVAVDDASGFVYYADERFGIRKYHADPDQPEAANELAVLGRDGYRGDREGVAIYANRDGTGYVVSSDQIAGGSRLMIYPREGRGSPHAQPLVAALPTISDGTDGLDVTPAPLPGFPSGLLVMMNSGSKNFLIYDWTAVQGRLPK